MKSLAIGIALLLCVSAINIDQDISMIELSAQKVDELSQSDMGKFIMEMAQMHAELRGPLDDLVETIIALESELSGELQVLDQNYQRRSNENVRVVQELQQSIGAAEIDISNSLDNIDSILIPGREQVNNRLSQLSKNIKENRGNLQKETLQRQKAHQEYLDRVTEHQGAINAIDEALALIGQLMNGNVAFTERASMHKSIQLIEKRLSKLDAFAPMIKELLTLAQNFSDQGQVKKIQEMLQDLRNNTVESLNQESADEDVRRQEWEEREGALNAEYREFQKQVNESTYQLTAYENKIQEEQEFVNVRKNDLSLFQGQLDSEQRAFATETELYQELRQQYLSDIGVATKAKDFINSAEFSNLIHSRINKGGVMV